MSRELLAGDVHTWAGYRLGRNEDGLWLYMPDGTPVHDAKGTHVDSLRAQAQLIPDDQPWVAAWRADGSIIADVIRPTDVTSRSIRFLDLGLRIVADESGTQWIETSAHDTAIAAGLVPAEQEDAARAVFSDLRQRMTDRVEPFDQVGRRWFTGIKRNELHFVAYDPTWPEQFRAARDEIRPVLPHGSRVEHFGSTSVPGLAAKDCLDIAAVVPRPEQINDAIEALAPIGYQARPNAFNDPGHIFLRRLTDGRRSHHLHLYYEGHQNLIEALAFRDLLRTDSDARERYQAVKRSLAEANPYDRSGYLAGKNKIVSELLRRALANHRTN